VKRGIRALKAVQKHRRLRRKEKPVKSRTFQGIAAAVLAFSIGAGVFASPIARIDVYDKADNHLLFVTFEYNGSGECIGRNVFTSDGTFLRTTRFTKDGGGNVTAENSIDYEDNPLSTTSISPQSGKTDFTIKDQFNMDLLGAPMSYTKGAAGEYTISQGGSTLYKQKYEFANDGSLSRVTFADAAGTLLYYAKVIQTGRVIRGTGNGISTRFTPVFRVAADGKLLVSFTLAAPSRVTLELFTPTGRLAAKTAAMSLAGGRRTLAASCDQTLGVGTYIARISADGSPIFKGHIVIVAR
jgi:hypothetical protein